MFNFILHALVFCLHTCLCEGTGSCGTGVIDNCELSCECGTLSHLSSPLTELLSGRTGPSGQHRCSINPMGILCQSQPRMACLASHWQESQPRLLVTLAPCVFLCLVWSSPQRNRRKGGKVFSFLYSLQTDYNFFLSFKNWGSVLFCISMWNLLNHPSVKYTESHGDLRDTPEPAAHPLSCHLFLFPFPKLHLPHFLPREFLKWFCYASNSYPSFFSTELPPTYALGGQIVLKYYVLSGLRCLTSNSATYWLCVFKQVVNPSETQTFQVKLANKVNGEALSQGNYQRVDRRVNNQATWKSAQSLA